MSEVRTENPYKVTAELNLGTLGILNIGDVVYFLTGSQTFRLPNNEQTRIDSRIVDSHFQMLNVTKLMPTDIQ